MKNTTTQRAASRPALDRDSLALARRTAAAFNAERLAPIPHGATVRLPDGSIATTYHDGDGTYRTAQPSGHGGTRVDLGWHRDFLEIVTPTGGAR